MVAGPWLASIKASANPSCPTHHPLGKPPRPAMQLLKGRHEACITYPLLADKQQPVLPVQPLPHVWYTP
ncbi:hypothetical protein HaLaN_29369 [Haematococcus lacustris]|uniref:Uncharacterized protein n=1 Tax=Haematococcus lacustris TaxID=44745 RepID=A0A6A0ACU9_HAELA|nr:hypothetical protein HaLaN_29369 [Haematococcus lacustris]